MSRLDSTVLPSDKTNYYLRIQFNPKKVIPHVNGEIFLASCSEATNSKI